MNTDHFIQREIHSPGELWAVPGVLPADDLLQGFLARDRLLSLRFGQPPYRVVFGVPHQSAVGNGQICERRLGPNGRPDPRPADENAAAYALAAFSHLTHLGVPCKLVIMAHATRQDPNKDPASPYCQQIFAEAAGLLFECHGMSQNRRLDLELSAGCNRRSQPLRLARLLAGELQWDSPIGAQAKPCNREAYILHADGSIHSGQLQRAALNTTSLDIAAERGMQAYHLEARPIFRVPEDGSNTLTPSGLRLGEAIANALQAYSLETQTG
jgi:hypothetical protein